MNKEQRNEFWDKLIQVIEGYLEENLCGDAPVVDYKSGKELEEILNLSIAYKGEDLEGVFSEIQKYLKYSVRTSHPHFNNQLYGGLNIEALAGEIVSFVANTSMSTYEISPVATLIEKKLVQEINAYIGYKHGSGIMVTGGSNANMMAIHCARQKMFPKTKHKGNAGGNLCVFVSKEAHYSFQKGINLLGIGMDNLIKVESDEQGVMDPEDLENKIIQTKEAGKTPLMVASTAGTTVLGAFDNISQNDKIAKKHGLWHHIDGAWGGAALFTKKLKNKLDGGQEADSFTFDAHKLLGTGLITSFFLTKDANILHEANGGGGGTYLFHEYENSEYDTGVYSLQCGRKVDCLKLWLAWKSLGRQGLEEFIDAQLDKRDYFVSLIEEHPRLTLMRRPQFLNVCFQVLPEDKSVDVNKYNFDLRFKLVREGKFLTNFSRFDDGTIFFRHILANNLTQKKDLKLLIDELTEA